MRINVQMPCNYCGEVTQEFFICESCQEKEHADVLVAEAREDR